MKKFVAKIWNSPSARNVGKLLSANVIAQALGIIIYPILTRLYTPEDFGLLNVFASIGGGLILLSTLEWYNAIVLPKKEQDASALVHLSFFCLLATSILLLLTIPFATPFAKLLNLPRFASFYWMLPIYVFLIGAWNILNYWYIRQKEYDRISGYQISQSLFAAGYKTTFAFLPFSGGLMYASILSPLCSFILSLYRAGRKVLMPLRTIHPETCKQVAVTYSNYPKYSTPRALLNYIVGQLPVLVLAPLFGERLIGFWGMALMLSFTPISIMSRALYQVLFRKTTEQVNAGLSIAPFYRWFTIIALSVIVPFFIILWFVLPALTDWLLGADWRVTGEYIRWMLPWLVFNILGGSTGYLVDIFFKQKTGLLFEILLAISRTIGVGIGIAMNNFEASIIGYAIGSAVINASQYIWYLTLVQRYEKRIKKSH